MGLFEHCLPNLEIRSLSDVAGLFHPPQIRLAKADRQERGAPFVRQAGDLGMCGRPPACQDFFACGLAKVRASPVVLPPPSRASVCGVLLWGLWPL